MSWPTSTASSAIRSRLPYALLADLLPPEFFVDRSLGSDAVPAALRAVGAEVVTMRELWGEVEAQALLDTEWIERLRESNPIVLMKDDRIRYRPAEQQRSTMPSYAGSS